MIKMKENISKYNVLVSKQYLQQEPENQYFERKGLGNELIKPSKIAEELIGMLNADGGLLVLGISDKGELQDLNSLGHDKLNEYRQLIFNFITPPCNIKLEEITLDGNLLFLYHVEQELERIFCHSGSEDYFLRVADTNRKLALEQIKKLEYDKTFASLKMKAFLTLTKKIWIKPYYTNMRRNLIKKISTIYSKPATSYRKKKENGSLRNLPYCFSVKTRKAIFQLLPSAISATAARTKKQVIYTT